jgi:LVIVD repeat
MLRSTGMLTVGLALLATSSAGASAPRMLGDGTPVQRDPFGAGRLAAAPLPTRDEPAQLASPRAVCGPGSSPEPGMQGRVPADAAAAGYHCNLTQLGHEGKSGGFKVERFVDRAGHECAYFDTTLLFPGNAVTATLDGKQTGTAVLDMSDPGHPVRTATLVTPAMQTPHESLLVNQRRGLLAAVMGNLAFAPGFIDIYDLNADCRHPELQSSSPVGILGHESGWAPDGNTFYATSLSTGNVTAVDVSKANLPLILGTYHYPSHGLTISDDGNRAYIAGSGGLQIVDVSEIQARKPSPQVHDISGLSWKNVTIPQVALPVTIGGHKFLVEIDEYSEGPGAVIVASNGPEVGAGRIIDIADERAPKVISNMRLAVNQLENRAAIANDPGASFPAQGYAGHYCSVPQATDPGIVACSFIASGLRVFDIRDPYKPKELAYFVAPPTALGNSGTPTEKSNYAMSKPSFVPSRGEIWYSDGNSGFYALRLDKSVWPLPGSSPLGLPSTRTCAGRRAFTIHLRAPRGQRLRSATVTVNGKRVPVKRGRRLTALVDLRKLPKGVARVTVVGRTTRGNLVRETRTYHPCAKRL